MLSDAQVLGVWEALETSEHIRAPMGHGSEESAKWHGQRMGTWELETESPRPSPWQVLLTAHIVGSFQAFLIAPQHNDREALYLGGSEVDIRKLGLSGWYMFGLGGGT